MHILIIPGERFNKREKIHSIFEYQQALELIKLGHDVNMISFKLSRRTFRSIIKNIYTPGYLVNHLKSFLFKQKDQIKFNNVDGINSFEISKYLNSIEPLSLESIEKSIDIAFNTFTSAHTPPNVIHGHSRFFLGAYLSFYLGTKYNIPFFVTEHSSAYFKRDISKERLDILNKIFDASVKAFVVSSQLGGLIKERIKDVNKDFTVLPNILDSKFEDLRIQKKKNSSFTFLNIAAFDNNKNQIGLIKAFALAFKDKPEIQLKLGGKGKLENKMHKLIHSLKMEEQIEIIGTLSRDQVVESMCSANIFVLASKFESFGVVLIEAMACGLPVLSTKCGGPESLVDESNGIIVDINEKSLADGLRRLYSSYNRYDPQNIRNQILSKYKGEIIAQKLQNYYSEALVTKHSKP